jgi:hypothetical protein
MRYPGGLIAPTPVNQQFPSGVWTGQQSAPYQAGNVWAYDSSFKNTTLLLHGDGATRSFTQDASTNNFQITLNGDTKPNNLTPFITNGYWSNLFGSNSGLTAPNNSAFKPATNDFTVEAWIFQTSSGTEQAIYGDSNAATDGGTFDFNINSTGFLKSDYWTSNTAVTTRTSTLSPTVNQWNHVVISRTGTTMYLGLNGVLQSFTAPSSYQSPATTYPTVGRLGAYTAGIGFIGYISNFRYVNGTNLYSGSTYTVPTAPLTAVTNTVLLTCQSNRFVDNSTNAFALTVNGSPSVSMQQPFTAPSGTSLFGSGYFDGATDFLTVASNAAFGFGTSDFTMECWVYAVSWVGSFDGFISTLNSVSAVGAHLSRDGVEVNGVAIAWGTTLQLGQWTHLALTRSGTSLRLFVNGVVTNTATNSANIGSSSAFAAGRRLEDVSNYYCNAYISNVRIVKGTAVYTAAFTPSTTPLTAIANTSLLTLQTNGPENNNGFLDSSLNSFPIARNGNTTQGAFSPYGTNWSNYFDGSSHLTTASSTALQAGTGAFTLEGWINVTGSTSGSILSQIPDVNAGYGIGIGYEASSNLLTGVITTTSTTAWIGSITPVKGVWYHMAFVRDASTNIALFINGVKITPTTGGSTNTTNINTATTFVSGPRFYDNPTRASFRLTGYVSNARFVKGSAVYDPTAASIAVPTTQLTAVTNTQLLILQANRIYDGSSNAFAITYSGTQSIQRFSGFQAGLQYGTQPVGGSGYFDGSGDYLNLAGQPAFAFGSNAFTVECWVYLTSVANPVTIYDSRPPATSGNYGILYCDAGGVVNWSGAVGIVGSTLVTNTWYHLAASRSGTTTRLFVNGVQAASATDTTSYLNGASAPVVGGNGYTRGAYTLPGYMVDLRVVNGTALYTSAFTPPTVPLTAITNTQLLLNYTNAAIFDNSGMSNLETVGNAQIDTSVVKYGTSSMYFDGSTSNLAIYSNLQGLQFGTGDFTVECWVNKSANGVNAYDSLVGLGATVNATQGWYLEVSTSRGIFFIINNVSVSFSTWVNDGLWHHIAVARSNGILYIFKDGVLLASGSLATAVPTTATVSRIGNYYNGTTNYYFNGYMDDLRITKGVARYVTNFTPPVARMPNQ